jgi:hypothetical protein
MKGHRKTISPMALPGTTGHFMKQGSSIVISKTIIILIKPYLMMQITYNV